jgi:hypothetical protein
MGLSKEKARSSVSSAMITTPDDHAWIGATALFEEEADTRTHLASLEADLELKGERVETEALAMPVSRAVPAIDAPRRKTPPAITIAEMRGIAMGTIVLSGWISVAGLLAWLVLFP